MSPSEVVCFTDSFWTKISSKRDPLQHKYRGLADQFTVRFEQ